MTTKNLNQFMLQRSTAPMCTTLRGPMKANVSLVTRVKSLDTAGCALCVQDNAATRNLVRHDLALLTVFLFGYFIKLRTSADE
jgi:hypothetical protein